MTPVLAAAILACAPSPSAITGDTFQCGTEVIRLAGIRAPQATQCPIDDKGCFVGDADKARAQLALFLRGTGLTIQRYGHDDKGQTLAIVWSATLTVNCELMNFGEAEHDARSDVRELVAGCIRMDEDIPNGRAK